MSLYWFKYRCYNRARNEDSTSVDRLEIEVMAATVDEAREKMLPLAGKRTHTDLSSIIEVNPTEIVAMAKQEKE